MAIIQLPKGRGDAGRSVFQKLRELKHLHEVSWGSETFLKTEDQLVKQEKAAVTRAEKESKPTPVFAKTKFQRGRALNAQKTNTVADMAAVLAGKGPGNMIRIKHTEGGARQQQGSQRLLGVTVSWSNDLDKEYAESWTENVIHELFENPEWTSSGELVGKAVATSEA